MTSPQTTPTLKDTGANSLRRAFLGFFEQRGHSVVPSSPLVPHGDPTMLFTTAGMVQFKPYYTGSGEPPFTRAVSVQKCLRLTDLLNVGLTPRHDTFFEMLGNFSFGDQKRGAYFKEEAIALAWEFVTQVLALPKERLYASIFEGEGKLPRDAEAAALWKKNGLPESHIVALGRKDNFWGPAGGQGACGPCSEIYFDLGEQRPEYLEEGAFWGERPGDPGDRYMEFWNLVFPQFDAQKDGTLKPLPRPGIDTGMGIERLALILQGGADRRIHSIFETDLFAPLVSLVLNSFRADRRVGPEAARDARIIADHMRAVTFAMAEDVFPGNEGEEYVLRRLLRRAQTRGNPRFSPGSVDAAPVLSLVAGMVTESFGDFYIELAEKRAQIMEAVARETVAFNRTFEAGRSLLDQALQGVAGVLDGENAFVLHDTYGFPIELTEEIAAGRGVKVDREGFERAMGEQRSRARAASKFAHTGSAGESGPWTEITDGPDSEFLGYALLAAADLRLRRWRAAGEEFELILDRTPCYAESGGQVADRGWVEGGGARAGLTHVYKDGESIVHRARLERGSREALIDAGARGALSATVDRAHRVPALRHHTATHLLHAALRSLFGTHVRQAGSLVAPDRLRFDYSHFEAPTEVQLGAIERRVNDWILANREVRWQVLPIAEARAMGAMALFGEKYGAAVRLVTVEGVPDLDIPPSLELCGGTHVSRTGDIGVFTIVSEGAIASGVRRIEALCGHEALGHFSAEHEVLTRAAGLLQTAPVSLPEQIEKLRGELERLRKAAAELQKGGLEAEMSRLAESASSAPGGRWVVAVLEASADAGAVRDAADRLRGALRRGAALLAIRGEGKLTFLAAVTDDLVAEKRLNASDLVKQVARVAGGSGGGKPHLALAGAKDLDRLDDALAEARRLITGALAGPGPAPREVS